MAGVFFHEALGHRLEGERQRMTESGQTFRDKVGDRIFVDDLPRDLHEALDVLEKDEVVTGALGEHIAGFDGISLVFQPFHEAPFFHRRRKRLHHYFRCHGVRRGT